MSETINPDTPSSGSPVLHNQAVRVPAEMESTGAEAVSGQEGGEREGSIVEQDLESRKADVEKRYIEALERKIIQLQSLVFRSRPGFSRSDPSSPSSSGASTPTQPDEVDVLSETRRSCDHGKILFKLKKFSAEADAFVETEVERDAVLVTKSAEQDLGHPFVWKQIVEKDGYEYAEVTINCPTLIRTLNDVLIDYPGHRGPRPRFSNEFLPLVHNWDRLQTLATQAPKDDPCQGHLKILLDILRCSKKLKRYFDTQEQHIQEKTVNFLDLERLFVHGQLVFATPFGAPQVFSVLHGSYDKWHGRKIFKLFCWTYDFDGVIFTRYPFEFHIQEFDKTKVVNTLRCYPLSHHEKAYEIKEQLKARGQKFREYYIKPRGQQMFDYDGKVYYNSYRPEDLWGEEYAGSAVMGAVISSGMHQNRDREPHDNVWEAEYDQARSRIFKYKGRVMVDTEAYRLYGPEFPPGRVPLDRDEEWFECDCFKCQNNDALQKRNRAHYDNIKPPPSGKWPEFEEEQLMMCPPRVKGYVLAKKMWVKMDVENVKIITNKTNTRAFDSLVLPQVGEWKDVKELIRSLVQYHTSGFKEKGEGVPGQLQDLIEGKGQGLIILLHGTSGVGKTLMAESVAEYTGRPLLKVSVADVGLQGTKVEKKLENIFQLASRWEAVLLFDEADILLEMRTDEAQLERNSMVSVFLKILEYYEGILLLTTNRIRALDFAVQSRVHLAIQFPAMGEDEQKQIFKMFINQIDPHDMERDGILEWVEDSYQDNKFNGRQIRNIISAAMALARAEERKLKLKDIQRVWKRTKTFSDYLRSQTIRAEMSA